MLRKEIRPITLTLFSLFALILSGCGSPEAPAASATQLDDGIPIGFAGDALMVVADGEIVDVQLIPTELPVMNFFGRSANDQALAYTSLAAAPVATEGKWRPIDHAQAKAMTLDQLVPTGQLVVEFAEGFTVVETADRFVIDAAWSPTDPSRLAFTYSREDVYGVAIVDVDANELVFETEGRFLADHLVWSDDGADVHIYQIEPVELLPEELDEQHEGEGPVRLQPTVIDFASGGVRQAAGAAQLLLAAPEPTALRKAPFALTLREGVIAEGDNLLGTTALSIAGHESIEVDRVIGWSDAALVYVDYTDTGMDLRVITIDDTEQIRDIAPRPSQVAVTYYLPFDNPTQVYVTQMGSSFNGGCSVSSHVGSMSYAIDMQISGSNNDEVVAPAAGTVANYLKTATNNCLDTVGCGIYSNQCGCSSACSGSGWGNYVILAHADGTWTKMTHLELGSVPVTGTGKSAARGCHLGDEGGTGKTSGSKGGCGDHLHFQRQTSSSSSGTSMTVSFADAALNSNSCGKLYNGTAGGMSCML